MYGIQDPTKFALRALTICGLLFAVGSAIANGQAATTSKPNILFIMGDDIGWMQPRIYHRGLMVGETPNIDRIGKEGGIFMTYYAEQSVVLPDATRSLPVCIRCARA